MVSCIVLLFLLLFLFLLIRRKMECYHPTSCIITMTTHMGFEDRFLSLPHVLDPLVQTGHEIVVINEWDQKGPSYVEYMEENYPQVKFIQKSYEDKGQARSLNMFIGDYLLNSSHKYWIHWEDTWTCVRPLFPDLINFMEKNQQVSQLQITDDWKRLPHSVSLKDITILSPPKNDNDDNPQTIYERQLEMGSWPLFSLRPSINRLSFFQRHAKDFYFLEHPHLWPLRFEWEFGRIFLRNKGIKAITNEPYAKRTKGHKSTYANLLSDFEHSGEKRSVEED